MMSEKTALKVGDKEVSSSCCPKTTVILEPNENQTKRRRRQNNFLQKKIPKKYQYPIEYWHCVMEHPVIKPDERIIIESFFIEDRTWKDVQEVLLQKTGVFNSTAALQMKINRLIKRIKSKSISKSRITTPLASGNSLSNEPRDILENLIGQEKMSTECQTQVNILQNGMNYNWDQSLSQEALSFWPCLDNKPFEQDFAWNYGHKPQLGWNNFDETGSNLPLIQLNDSNKFFTPDISYSLCSGDNSVTEVHYESQPMNYLTENFGYNGVYYPIDQSALPLYEE